MIFGDGASIATIMLLIRADNISELNEVTTVTLTRIVANGVSESGDQRRGARLALGQTEAVITVQANDEPHGVIAWSPTVIMVQEQEGTNNEVQLTLVREFGSIGAVVISYSTQVDASLPINERAESLMDFVPTSGEIVMGDGESSASIRVTILQVSKNLIIYKQCLQHNVFILQLISTGQVLDLVQCYNVFSDHRTISLNQMKVL